MLKISGQCPSPTFLATKRTIRRAAIKQPAAILAVRSFVDASINTMPQKDEPISESTIQG